jgi:hypothetical protein
MSPLQQAWPDYVDDAAQSKLAVRFMGQDKYNILYKKVEQMELNDSETRTISYANYSSSQWSYLIIRVIGEARVNTTGFDTNGSTPITGKLPIYGSELLPGIGILSSYNVSTFTVESLADGTLVELFAAIAAADNDPLIDQNA